MASRTGLTWFAGLLVLVALAGTTCVPLGATDDSLQLTTGSLPTAEMGMAYAATVKAAGGTQPYTYSRTRGDGWPSGLSLHPETGLISGVPESASGGAYFVDVAVTDSADPPAVTERRLTLIVFEPGNEFAAIRTWILPTCAASACHSQPTHLADLVLEPSLAYANLVGIAPSNAAARSNGRLLVDPGSPATSFFLSKISGDLEADEGTVMPQAGVSLPDEQVALVRQWIEQGAMPPPDGVGVGTNGDGTGGASGPTLEIGETIEQIYAPLSEGRDLLVWFGTQGGVWIIPTIRVTGLDTSVSIEAELTRADTGDVLGGVSFPTNMTPTLDGTELQNITVPIFDDSGINSLFGTDVVLRFTVRDDEGKEVARTLTLVLQPA